MGDLFDKAKVVHQYKPGVILGLYQKSGVRNIIDILPHILKADPDLMTWMKYFKSVGSAYIVVDRADGFCALWKEKRA